MADLDEKEVAGITGEIEKAWDITRKKLTRKLHGTDKDSNGVSKLARKVEFEDGQRDEILSQHAAEGDPEMTELTDLPENTENSTPGAAGQDNSNKDPLPSFIPIRPDRSEATSISSPSSQKAIDMTSSLRDVNMSSPLKGTDSMSSPFRRVSEGSGPEFAAGEEELGPERSAFVLLKAIQSGSIDANEIPQGERRIVVDSLRKQGRTQDEIAALLEVSRRTIVSDYRWLKDKAVDAVRRLDAHDLAAEVHELGMAAVERALYDGKPRMVAQVLRDVIEMLQSLGIVYRAPATSKVSALVGHVPVQQGYSKYLDQVTPEREKVVAVLEKMMDSLGGTS